jgi:hypothetical protein
MNAGEKAGWWAMAYLYIALVGVWFTVACIAWYHIKEWFL